MNKQKSTQGKLASAGASTIDNPLLAEHADAIRSLGKRVIADVIEIGRRLTEAKKLAGRGNWLLWLEREFGWTDKTAENFVNVYKLSQQAKIENFSDLSLPVSGLYLLAAPSTPKEARDEIIDRAEAGEKVSVAEIKETIAEAKLSTAERHTPGMPADPAANTAPEPAGSAPPQAPQQLTAETPKPEPQPEDTGLTGDLLQLIHGTVLADGAEFDAFRELSPGERRRLADLAHAGHYVSAIEARAVADAEAVLGETKTDDKLSSCACGSVAGAITLLWSYLVDNEWVKLRPDHDIPDDIAEYFAAANPRFTRLGLIELNKELSNLANAWERRAAAAEAAKPPKRRKAAAKLDSTPPGAGDVQH
jgi:hypothetical protein